MNSSNENNKNSIDSLEEMFSDLTIESASNNIIKYSKKCRNEYGNLTGNQTSEEKKKFLEFFKSMDIEYVGATELLKEIIKLNLKY